MTGGTTFVLGGGGVPALLQDDPRVRYAPDVRRALDILEDLATS